jgi:hypothetical protein
MSIIKALIGLHERDVEKRLLTPKKKRGKQPLKPERYSVTLHNGREIKFGE